jgi:hypothetical protein
MSNVILAFLGGMVAMCLIFAFALWLLDRKFGPVGSDD